MGLVRAGEEKKARENAGSPVDQSAVIGDDDGEPQLLELDIPQASNIDLDDTEPIDYALDRSR